MIMSNALTKFRKKGDLPVIKTIPAGEQVVTGRKGFYDIESGEIGIGSTCEECPKLIFHETVHKTLFEQVSFEACTMFDNIADNVEKHLFGQSLWGGSPPYAMTLPPKKAATVPHKHLTLGEKGIIPEDKPEEIKKIYESNRFFGIGVSVYREKEEECISKKVHLFVQDKKYKEAAEISADIIGCQLLSELKAKGIKILANKPSFGIYQGEIEPSAMPLMKGNVWKYKDIIHDFRKITKQDSILLWEIVPDGFPAYEIDLTRGQNIITLQKKLISLTDGKFGNFMTYVFKDNVVIIINVPEFDGLKKEEFLSYQPILKSLFTNVCTFNVRYEVI